MAEHFADRLSRAVRSRGSRVVVGLDPDPRHIPTCFGGGAREREALAAAQRAFNEAILEATADLAVAVKLQSAYYEVLGPPGIACYEATVGAARAAGLLTLGDVKRADIGATSAAYARAHLGWEGAPDAITVNPYLGSDGVLPFVEEAKAWGRGVFVLVRTSNPSAVELQGLRLAGEEDATVVARVARLVSAWNEGTVGEEGYGLVGAVVGATAPAEAATLRGLLPRSLFLVPGYGAQGAGGADVAPCFDAGGGGAVVNASRSILYAFREETSDPRPAQVVAAARRAALAMRDDVNRALGR